MILLPAVDIRDGKAVRLRQGALRRGDRLRRRPARGRALLRRGRRALPARGRPRRGARGRAGQPAPRGADHARARGARGATAAACARSRRSGARSRRAPTASSSAPRRTPTPTCSTRRSRPSPRACWSAVDVRDGKVSVSGWTRETQTRGEDAIRLMQGRGVTRFVYTNVDRDGMLEGPDLDEVRRMGEAVRGRFLYSGGIGSLDDLAGAARPAARQPRRRDLRQGALRAPLHGRRGAAGPGRLMLLRRVIPCLDVDKGRVVKGIEFVNIRDAGDPVELAVRYQDEGADEIVFLDITASHERRDTGRRAGPPLRRRRLHPVHDRRRRALRRGRAGGARRRRGQGVGQLGRRARGPSCSARWRRCSAPSASCWRSTRASDADGALRGLRRRRPPRRSGRDAVEWAREGVERGAGEILLTSMDRDGTEDGYELDADARGRRRRRHPGDRLAAAPARSTTSSTPSSEGGADAVLCASIFHYGTYTVARGQGGACARPASPSGCRLRDGRAEGPAKSCASGSGACPAWSGCCPRWRGCRPCTWSAAPCATCCAASRVVDLDLAVEGDARVGRAHARRPARRRRPREHERFGTATVRRRTLTVRPGRDPQRDLRRAGRAAARATGRRSSEDLRRRDFTINAMAIGARRRRPRPPATTPRRTRATSTRASCACCTGAASIDDPTRLLRAVRYEARLGFGMEEATEELARAAVAEDALSTVSGARVRDELIDLLAEHEAPAAVERMLDLGLDRALDTALDADPELVASASLGAAAIGADPALARSRRWSPRRPTRSTTGSTASSSTARDRDRRRARGAQCAAARGAAARARAHALGAARPARRRAARGARAGAGAGRAPEPILRYVTDLSGVRLEIGGDDLLAPGVPEGPALGRALEETLRRKLDGARARARATSCAPRWSWPDDRHDRAPGAPARFSTRLGGVSEGPTVAQPRHPHRRRARPGDAQPRAAGARRPGSTASAIAMGWQVHGTDIQEWDGPARSRVRAAGRQAAPAVDGHVTRRAGLGLLVLVADCLSGRARRTASGSRWSTAAGAGSPAGSSRGRSPSFDAPPAAAVGPGIGGCCYEVGPRGLGALRGRRRAPRTGGCSTCAAVIEAPAARGRGVERVEHLDRCTSCRADLYLLAPARRRRHRPAGRARVACARPGERTNLERVRERIGAEVEILCGDQVRGRRRPAGARRGGHRAGRREPRPGAARQAGAPRRPVHLGLHRRAPEPQGEGHRPERAPDPLGRVGIGAAPARGNTRRARC